MIFNQLIFWQIENYHEIATRTNAHQSKMKLSSTKKKGCLYQRRIPCDLILSCNQKAEGEFDCYLV
ncbi:MAG: hypothetical protein ACUVQP_09250, partial [Bacteroidales bacterium]